MLRSGRERQQAMAEREAAGESSWTTGLQRIAGHRVEDTHKCDLPLADTSACSPQQMTPSSPELFGTCCATRTAVAPGGSGFGRRCLDSLVPH